MTDEELRALRVCVAGGPRVGKTTYALRLGGEKSTLPVLHTDDLIGEADWSGASEQVAAWMDEPGPWVIEGVAVPRALRKWLRAHPEGKPCDVVVWLSEPREERTRGQVSMAAGCLTVMSGIEGELAKRGVRVVEGWE